MLLPAEYAQLQCQRSYGRMAKVTSGRQSNELQGETAERAAPVLPGMR